MLQSPLSPILSVLVLSIREGYRVMLPSPSLRNFLKFTNLEAQ